MIKYISSALVAILVVLSSNLLVAQTRIAPEKPKLVIGIVIEDLRHDYLNRYWDKFGEDGFRKLLTQGSFCKNATLDYLLAQAAAGNASIVTGSSPAIHGIVSDTWYDRYSDEIVECLYDKKMKLVGNGAYSGKVSPRNMLTSTFTDELKLSKTSGSKVISIASDYESAILAAGHAADAAYWFDPAKGNWVSNNYYMEELPQWLKAFNAKLLPELYMTKEWKTLLPLEAYKESLPDKNKYEKGFKKAGSEFPYLPEKLKTKEMPYEQLFSTPYGNTFSKDFFLETIESEQLGADDETDVLFVNFSSFAKIEDLFGQKSVEMEDAFLRFDKELEHFLEYIEEQLGKQNVLVYVTSSSYGLPNIEYLQDNNIPADYFQVDKAKVLLKAYMNAIFGAGDWVLEMHNQQVYLNRELIDDSNLDLAAVQRKVSLFMMELNGVQRAVAAIDLQTSEYTEGLMSLMQNSFHYRHSGDVFIQLQPGWVEKNGNQLNGKTGLAASVPLVWYGWKIKRATINRKVSIFDIAPTISSFLKINKPAGCEGQVILELVE